MKNIYVVIFVCYESVRSSESITYAANANIGFTNGCNPPGNPHATELDDAGPSNEPTKVTFQMMLDEIKSHTAEIEKLKEEAENQLKSHELECKLLEKAQSRIKDLQNDKRDNPKIVQQKEKVLHFLTYQIEKQKELVYAAYEEHKKVQDLFVAKTGNLRIIIEQVQKNFPDESRDGLKHFEEFLQVKNTSDVIYV